MSESQETDGPNSLPEAGILAPPLRLTPSPDSSEIESKLSRKREREVSIEPVTTPSASNDELTPRERKDSHSRTPMKKNRRRLDPTEEEGDDGGSASGGSGSGSPPTATTAINLASPRQEMKIKVRQISRGVEDINWKSVESIPAVVDRDVDIGSEVIQEQEENPDEGKGGDSMVDDEHTSPKTPENPILSRSTEIFDKEDTTMDPENSIIHHQQANNDGMAAEEYTDLKTPDEELELSHPAENLWNEDIPLAPKDSHAVNEKISHDDQDEMVDDENVASPKTPEPSGLSHSVESLQKEDATMIPASPEVARLRAESNDKGLKRKFLERGTSHGPPDSPDTNGTTQVPLEPIKRPRDDADKDDNPRETKRPTPPPSPPRDTPPSPKIPKMSGFMAYASSHSPFSAVKGQNIFGSSKNTPSPPPFSSSPVISPGPVLDSPFGSSSLTTTTVPKRSGFEAFASSSSPFATAAAFAKSPLLGSTSKLGRAKSPARSRPTSALSSNPFASYAGQNQGFALPAQKRARAGSPGGSSRSSLERPASASVFAETGNGSDNSAEDDQDESPQTTFGERLRAGRDDEDEKSDEENAKMMLTEQDVMTGEEEEETLHQVRGKLFSLQDSQWKERGTGLLKLNVKVDDGTGARLVMRKDAVYTLLLNVTLFPGMKCSLAQDPRYLRFSAIEGGAATTYNLKLSNAKIAADLLEEINANIPT